MAFQSTPASLQLLGWIGQLEEFAHKAVARRDIQAAKSTLGTMAEIGIRYAEARRDSIVLTPDYTSIMPMGVSDVRRILNPIHESIKNVCHAAVRQPDEAVVAACITELGGMAVQAMTMVHTQASGWKTTPLSHAPVYYLKVCADAAAKAQMDDALLAAVHAIGPVFGRISNNFESEAAEATAVNCLFDIAVAAYARRSHAPADEAVNMMLAVAKHELKVRGFPYNHGLRSILNNIATLVPFEVLLERSGQRVGHVFAPYGQDGLVTLLFEESKKVAPHEHHWVNPYRELEELSQQIVDHYREIGQRVDFNGTLIELLIVQSALNCAEIHLDMLVQPIEGTERHLDTIESQLIWFIHTPSFFFNEQSSFPYHHVNDAAGRIAILGMRLLQLNRLETAKECAEAIASLGKKTASITNANAFRVADIFIKLEIMARAADALDHSRLATVCRALEKRDENEVEVPDYRRAIQNRIRYLDRELEEDPARETFSLREDPTPLLRKILDHSQRLRFYRASILQLILKRYS
jgi:hypothetical protein